ncbi:MAG: phosphatidylserine decarboxylase [Betaproteobacteria bacterium]|nr:phosphatidylserine decarboxylase [Betaproteobacteria bacterium]
MTQLARAHGVPDVHYRPVTDELNFLVTNRIPRIALTRFMGWFSRIEHPLIVRLALALWRAFADLRLDEAKKSHFTSVHDCFVRELKEGARPIDANPAVLTSPCDAIVGASGSVRGTVAFQAKGFPYSLLDLLGDARTAARYVDATYVTLRITSSMYHRFHAPHDCRVGPVTYFSGDTWNVNPPALARVQSLFCKNERALIRVLLEESGHEILLVPVAAVLVASIRLNFLPQALNLRYRGPNVIPYFAEFKKGEEMGRFEHGSTILVFAPRGFKLLAAEGSIIRAGQPLMRVPAKLRPDPEFWMPTLPSSWK